MNFEKMAFNGNVNEDSYARHEQLQDEYKRLEETLIDLRGEFNDFLKKT